MVNDRFLNVVGVSILKILQDPLVDFTARRRLSIQQVDNPFRAQSNISHGRRSVKYTRSLILRDRLIADR